jgi:Uncharacterized protein conserved in bacteria (DUF2184)
MNVKQYKIVNSKGVEVLLNSRERAIAENLQMQAKPYFNALGYEISITTLTTIIKEVSEQKFFQIPFEQYVPVKVGNGAWSSNLVTYRSFVLGDDFETGIINTGANNSRLAEADAGVDSITATVFNWAKNISWSLPDLALAAKSGNWDLISAKEEARKKNWDLGLQKIAFLGLAGSTSITGLLNLSGVTSNLTRITKLINSMTAAEFNTLIQGIIQDYRSNAVNTVYPTHFIIPETDYNGLASFPDSTYPLKTKLELLTEAFKIITMNPNFKILPCAYADKANNSTLFNKNRYVLLNYDARSVRMDIPVDYTATLANSVNNFQFQNVGYGQFTGVNAYRPLEILYFDF